MNLGVYVCLFAGVLFLLLALLFTLLKGKAAMLISGFNTIPKEQRRHYDTEKMSKDQRNSFLLWSLIMLLGAGASYFFSASASYLAFVVWLIVFFKDVHLSEEKAFGKYKK